MLPGAGMAVEGIAMIGSPTQMLKGGAKLAGRAGLKRAAGEVASSVGSETAEATVKAAGRTGCFVESVEVVTVGSVRPISEISVSDVVVAAASTDGDEEPWVEVEDAPVEEGGAWAPRGVCDQVLAGTPKWVMPAMVALAACGVEPELPADHEVV